MKKIYTLKLSDKLVRLGHKFIYVGPYTIVFSSGVATGITEDIINLILDKNGSVSNTFKDIIIEVSSDELIEPVKAKVEVSHNVEELKTPTVVQEFVTKITPEVVLPITMEDNIVVEKISPINSIEMTLGKVETPTIVEATPHVVVRPTIVDTKIPETEDLKISKEDLQKLYDELKSWSKVAKKLDVSPNTLSKYRKSIGL